MPTTTMPTDTLAALLDYVASNRKSQSEDVQDAVARLTAALDGVNLGDAYTLTIFDVNNVARFTETFRRKGSKHLTTETRLVQKANKEALLLLDGERLEIAEAESGRVVERRGVEAPKKAARKPAAKKTAPAKKSEPVKVKAVKAPKSAPVEAPAEAPAEAEPVAV